MDSSPQHVGSLLGCYCNHGHALCRQLYTIRNAQTSPYRLFLYTELHPGCVVWDRSEMNVHATVLLLWTVLWLSMATTEISLGSSVKVCPGGFSFLQQNLTQLTITPHSRSTKIASRMNLRRKKKFYIIYDKMTFFCTHSYIVINCSIQVWIINLPDIPQISPFDALTLTPMKMVHVTLSFKYCAA